VFLEGVNDLFYMSQFTQGKELYPTRQRNGWPPEPVGMLWGAEEHCPGIEPQSFCL